MIPFYKNIRGPLENVKQNLICINQDIQQDYTM